MTDPIRRALRTFLQSWCGIFLGLWALSGIGADGDLAGISDLATIGKVALAAAIGAIPALVAFVQNLLEDTTSFPAILKAPASEGVNPVPDEAGSVNWTVVTAVATVVMLVILVRWAIVTNLFG